MCLLFWYNKRRKDKIIWKEKEKKMIGKTYKVLVEGVSKNNDKLLTGRTSQNKVVIFDGDKSNIGKIVNVEILSEHLWYLKGKIV